MKDICFFTCYDFVYKEMGEALVRSVKRFYPEIDFIVFDVPRKDRNSEFDLRAFCDFHLQKGKELLEQYRRIISIDTDHLMCNFCPDLFGNFDFAVVRNNIPVGNEYGGIDTDVYINAGLTICANKDVWWEWMEEYTRRNNTRWEILNEQNALNHIYHNFKHKYNFKMLEFKDKSYGISDNFIYPDMYLDKGELYLTNGKKICMFHAAGIEWKQKQNGVYNFDLIKNDQARDKLRRIYA